MNDLLIFFDNQSFKLNNIIINYIKRWIVYKIINNYKEYDNIYLFKTYPEFVEKKITLNNVQENIHDVLIWINNVIYKKYESYPTLCLKKIFDKIKTLPKVSYKNVLTENNIENEKIIILTSIHQYEHNFTESNISYINDVLNNNQINITLINISGNNFLNDLFPKINEKNIDVNCLRVENFQINKLLNVDNIDDLLNVNKYIDFDTTNNICKFTTNLSLFEYLLLIFEIEYYILQNFVSADSHTKQEFLKKSNIILDKICQEYEENKGLDKEDNENNENKGLDKEDKEDKEKYNNQILNILKSYKNSIKDIILRQMDMYVDLPINELTPELSASYIKYILEFYSIIYPKINYFNSLHNSIKKNKQKNIIKSFSSIQIKNIKELDLDESDISCKFLTSSLTITNWAEEYVNANPFGFIIKYIPSKLSYKGIFDINSSIIKTYPNIVVNNITTNFTPLYDYYQIILFDYEENKDTNIMVNNNYKDEKKKIFDISKFNIPDNINGDGNVMLPLYINKSHWELTKSLWKYHISFINNCFEQEYNNKMDNIYFYSILKTFYDLKKFDNNKNIKTIIRLFCYLLRTCIQILIDNKFIHSVKNDYKKYLNLVLDLETVDKNSIFADWIIRLVQLIISNGISNEELQSDLNKITNFIFNKYIIANYKMDFWDMINNSNTSDKFKKSVLLMLKNKVIQENISWLYLNFDLQIFNKIIKSIYSINGFNQFIKQIDKTNGCLVDTNDTNDTNKTNEINIKMFENIIKNHNKIQFDTNNYPIDISKYCIKFNLNEINNPIYDDPYEKSLLESLKGAGGML